VRECEEAWEIVCVQRECGRGSGRAYIEPGGKGEWRPMVMAIGLDFQSRRGAIKEGKLQD
jgi:hypothetical protein